MQLKGLRFMKVKNSNTDSKIDESESLPGSDIPTSPVIIYLGTKKIIIATVAAISATLFIVKSPFEVEFKCAGSAIKSMSLCPFLYPVNTPMVSIMTSQIVSFSIAPPFIEEIYNATLESIAEEAEDVSPEEQVKPKINRLLH